MKVLCILFIFSFAKGLGQTTIMSENMGTTGGAHATIAANTFQNVGLTFSGTGSTNTTNASTGYTGASGNQNIILNNTNFQIAGINTSACSNIKLSFGLYKGTTAPDGSSLLVEVSTNGSTYFSCSFSVLPVGSGTTGWYLINVITSIPSTANLRLRFTESSGVTLKIDDVKLIGTCGGANSITAGAITTAPFNISTCTSSVTGTIAFTSSGTFNSGNVYTVQLSNNYGGFDYPISIGTLTSTSNSGTISFTLPANTLAGTSYLIHIVSSNPSVVSTISSYFTITSSCAAVCPSITGALVNGCAGSCNAEGNNEMVFLNSGSFTIPVNSKNINISFNGTNFTSSFAPQPSVISNLNSLAGCSVFTDLSSGTIPANSSVILMNSGSCFNYDFSSYCSSSPVFVIFSADVSWTTTGFFTNSGSSVRSWITDFSALSSSCGTTTYSYIPDNLTNYAGLGDGGSVTYNSAGGSPSYINGGCTPPYTILPIELVDFYATQNAEKNDLVWKVASEKNVSQYIVEKSEDGINFKEFVRVNSLVTEGKSLKYMADDTEPYSGITYYRLSTLESNGKINTYKIIDIDRSNKDWKTLLYQNNYDLILEFKNSIPKESQITLFDLTGKQLIEKDIEELQTKINTELLSAGIYFVKITSPYKTENFKIIIQK